MLVELGLVEQRHRAVLEVLDGCVGDGGGRPLWGVSPECARLAAAATPIGVWPGWRIGRRGRMGVRIRCRRGWRRGWWRCAGPSGWGPRTIRSRLAAAGVDPLPGRSSMYRCLVRHGLVEVARRRRRREDYRRWERSRAMELWQMDVVSRFYLADGTELHALTGVDDHSRFCVSAALMARATARPVCERLEAAFAAHGVPDQILTDNGKVFTARFGTGPGPTLFDRVCAQNGVRHLLTAPRSPTTTGKIERFHKTWRNEFVAVHDYQHQPRWPRRRRRWMGGWSSTTRPGRISRWGIGRRWSGSVWPARGSSRSMPRPARSAGGVRWGGPVPARAG